MKKVVISFAFIALVFAGCSKNPNIDLEGDRDIVIHFTPQASVLKSSIGLPAESTISSITVYGVESAGNADKLFDLTALPPSGHPYTLLRKYTSLYAIANNGSLTIPAGATTRTALEALTGSFASAPASPFLMSGTISVADKSVTTVTIELVRAVAKVEINAQDFVIQSVTVQSTPNMGYVFGKSPFAIPSGGSFAKVNYPLVNYSSSNNIFYVAENVGATTPTQFLVTGTYLGKTANYTFSLTKGGTKVDILRNTHYVVKVTAITQDDFIINVTIKQWDDVNDLDEVVIPDNVFI